MNTSKKANRACLNCGKSILHKKSNAKFCANKCRSEYFNKNNASQTINPNLKDVPCSVEKSIATKAPLKLGAIVGEQRNNFLPKNNKVLDELYKSLRHKQSILNQLANYDASELTNGTINAAYNLGKDKGGSEVVGFLSGALAFCGSVAYSYVAGPTIKKAINERIEYLEEEILWIKKAIQNIEKNNGMIFPAPARLSGSNPILHTPKALINNADQINDRSNKLVNTDTNTKADGKDSQSKAITIQQLKKIEYQELNFKGRWMSFIGFPSIIFFMVIFGKAGEGKSTFAILFADFLSTHFGRVLYISGEEGFAKTFQDKVERLDVNANDLYVVDSRSIDDIKAELETRHYNFVFIDSLDTLGIGPQEMKELRLLYPDIAFITISQSTKDGKMRGSNELIHDCDIVIQVADGVAVTTKNRFMEKGREFKVF